MCALIDVGRHSYNHHATNHGGARALYFDQCQLKVMVQVSPHRRIAIGNHITTTCFASRQFAKRPNVTTAAGWLVMLSLVLCC